MDMLDDVLEFWEKNICTKMITVGLIMLGILCALTLCYGVFGIQLGVHPEVLYITLGCVGGGLTFFGAISL